MNNIFSSLIRLGEHIFDTCFEYNLVNIRKQIKNKELNRAKSVYNIEKIDRNIIEQINKNIENSVKALKQYNKIFEIEITSKHPGVILSSGNYINLILENGIFFDVFTNAPKIPESSINGALNRILNFKLKESIKKECSKLIKLTTISLFGIPANSEKEIYRVITMNNSFLKNIKKRECKNIFDKISHDLKIDKENLKEIKAKLLSTEFLDPLPIHLIIVPENIKFKVFFIFKEENIIPKKGNSLDFILSRLFGDLNGLYTNDELLKEILKLMFEIYGLGSKTAYGFGKFKINSMGWLKND